MEITLPSIHDPGLAPAGKHVLSAIVQYAPYALKGGWDNQRDKFQQLMIDLIASYAPGLQDMIDHELLEWSFPMQIRNRPF